MRDYAGEIVALVKAKNPAEPEFHQAVLEVVESTALVIERHPEYRARQDHGAPGGAGAGDHVPGPLGGRPRARSR